MKLIWIHADYRIDRSAVRVLSRLSLSILLCTSGIKRLSMRCDDWGIEIVLVVVVCLKLLARACQSLLLRFSQYMLWCRLISLVSNTYCIDVLLGKLSWSLIQAYSTAMGTMSLDIWQVMNLH